MNVVQQHADSSPSLIPRPPQHMFIRTMLPSPMTFYKRDISRSIPRQHTEIFLDSVSNAPLTSSERALQVASPAGTPPRKQPTVTLELHHQCHWAASR